MTSQYPSGVQLDSVHSGAICEAIGEGLRVILTGNPNQLPPHILGLTQRFDSVDCGKVGFRNSIEVDSR